MQNLTNLSFFFKFLRHQTSVKKKKPNSRLRHFYSNMPDMPNFIRKHVFNFRPLNIVMLIRMSIYECIIKNKRLRNFISFNSQQYLAYQNA